MPALLSNGKLSKIFGEFEVFELFQRTVLNLPNKPLDDQEHGCGERDDVDQPGVEIAGAIINAALSSKLNADTGHNTDQGERERH